MAKGEEFNHRNVIAELYCAGNGATEIIKATGYAKSTIYHIVSCLKFGKGVEHKPDNSRNDIKCTPCFLAGLKHSIKANLLKSIASLAKSHNVSKMTIFKAIRINLNMNSYVRRH